MGCTSFQRKNEGCRLIHEERFDGYRTVTRDIAAWSENG
jgi:hypothetical protein